MQVEWYEYFITDTEGNRITDNEWNFIWKTKLYDVLEPTEKIEVALNSNELNYFDESIWDEKENNSSFSPVQLTKYAILTPLWQFYNIWDFCIKGRYWNNLLDTDIENLSEKEIEASNNPIRNGWILQSTRFSQKELFFEINILQDSFFNLEKETRLIKNLLNLEGCKIIKKETDRTSEIDVILEDVEIAPLHTKWTECTLSFISYDPFFKKPFGSSKTFSNITWNLDTSLIVNLTDHKPFINTTIDLKEVTWTITNLELELDWFKVNVDCNISSNEIIIFDWQSANIFIWNTEILDWTWKFMPFPINLAKNVKISFFWGTADLYSVYFSYDNLYN